jgi:hypothetical protein
MNEIGKISGERSVLCVIMLGWMSGSVSHLCDPVQRLVTSSFLLIISLFLQYHHNVPAEHSG